MASRYLPGFPPFNVAGEPQTLGVEWNKWIGRFDNLLLALEIRNPKRQKALMLYYAGKGLQDIYKNLVEPSDTTDYITAKILLTSYFQPSRNETFDVYNFRSLRQQKTESIDTYVRRLMEAADKCRFSDVRKEVKHQLVFGCLSAKLRKFALSENPSLECILKKGANIERYADKNNKNVDTDKTVDKSFGTEFRRNSVNTYERNTSTSTSTSEPKQKTRAIKRHRIHVPSGNHGNNTTGSKGVTRTPSVRQIKLVLNNPQAKRTDVN